MKKLRFVLLLCMALLFQNDLVAQDFVVSLKGAKINIPDNPYQVVEVIDARTEKSSLGFVFSENLFTKRQVKIKGGIKESLLSVFNSGFNSVAEPIPMIIKINKLSVFEDGFTIVSEKMYYAIFVEINIEFYIKENDTYYYEFMAGKYSQIVGTNIKVQVNDKITKVIENCCVEFLHRMKYNLGYHQQVAEQELYENSLDQKLLAKTKISNRKNCIYYTFNGFRDGLADTVSYFTKESTEYAHDAFPSSKFSFKSGEINASEVWGVNYDNQLYLNISGEFLKVNATAMDYVIETKVLKQKNSNYFGPAVAGPLSFGLVSLVVGTIAPDIGENSNNLDFLRIKYKIDMATGLLILAEEPKSRKFEGELLFYTAKIEGGNLELFINGKKQCNFKPDSYFSVTATLHENPVSVCLKSDSDEYCETISPDIFNTMYFEAIISKKGKVSLFEKKSPSKKSSIDFLIKKGKMKKIVPENE